MPGTVISLLSDLIKQLDEVRTASNSSNNSGYSKNKGQLSFPCAFSCLFLTTGPLDSRTGGIPSLEFKKFKSGPWSLCNVTERSELGWECRSSIANRVNLLVVVVPNRSQVKVSIGTWRSLMPCANIALSKAVQSMGPDSFALLEMRCLERALTSLPASPVDWWCMSLFSRK